MRRSFLGVCAFVVCGCGGADTTIPEGGGGDGPDPMMDGGGGDGSMMDACVAQPEVCGDGLDNDCDGVVDNGCKSLGTYVSGATGLDTNPGTKVSPVKTIAQGIKNAQMIGGKLTVYVGNSHYPEKVTLVEGISLEGGYHCDMMLCDWMRNPGTYDTAILNTDFEGVLVPATITRQTRIDGFRVQGMPGAPPNFPGTFGISVRGNATISQNRVNGGDSSAGRTTGIGILAPIMDPAGPLVENNDIQGGANSNNQGGSSYGISWNWQPNPPPNSSASGLVRNNRIKGGQAEFTAGINAASSSGQASIIGNSITGGNSPGGNFGTSSWGIQVGGTVLIDSNLINTDQNAAGGCAGIQWCGGIASYSSTSTIVNNIVYGNKGPNTAAVLLTEGEVPGGLVILNGNFLDGAGVGINGNLTKSTAIALQIGSGQNSKFGRNRNNILQGGINSNRFGVYEAQIQNKTNKPEFLEFNQFFFPALQGRTDVFWRQWTANAIVDVIITPPMNQSGDPMVDNTWHLLNGSPCIDKGTMTEAPGKDRDGNNRPMGMGFDIGADEK